MMYDVIIGISSGMLLTGIGLWFGGLKNMRKIPKLITLSSEKQDKAKEDLSAEHKQLGTTLSHEHERLSDKIEALHRLEVEKKAFQEANYRALNQDQQRIVDSAKNVSVLVELFENSNHKNIELQQKVNEQLREIRELKEVNREQREQIDVLRREMVHLARTNEVQPTRQNYDRHDDFSL